MLFWGLHRWLERRPINRTPRILQRYSRHSLTTYVVYHTVHIWPLRAAARWTGRRDPCWYYADAVSTPPALALTIRFVAGFYGVLVAWDRCKAQYTFEWQLYELPKPVRTGD